MYQPKEFVSNNPQVIKKLVQEYSFSTIINGEAISHLPLLLEGPIETGILQGHFARPNQHWKMMRDQPQTTAIFHGPEGYISPRYYSGSEEVPTWNYAIVHFFGKATIIEEHQWLTKFLLRLTEENENRLGNPWKLNSSSSYFKSLLRGIVGFEIKIEKVQAKFKLSQNRSEEDQRQVQQACLNSDSQSMQAMGKLMKTLRGAN